MKKRVLLISPVPSHPQTAGNRARIYTLALSIKQFGHELYFVHLEREPCDNIAMEKCWGTDSFFSIPTPYKKNPENLSFRIGRKLMKLLIDKDAKYHYHIDAFYNESLEGDLKKLYNQYHFDIVFVEYVFFSKALTCFPDHVLKVLDTHDVMTDRHKQYMQHNNKYSWFTTSAAQERKGLRRADIIVAIQEGERDFFARLTQKKTITVGHTVKTRKQKTDALFTGSILFLGSANQSNIDTITVFIRDMFPGIKREFPNATLLLAGEICSVLDDSIEGIIKLGSAEDLDAIYDKADMVINPIRIGTGLKIKNIEALGYSKPLVTTSIGAQGMEMGIDSAFLVADDAQCFSDAVIKILREPILYSSLAKNGYEFAVDWNQRQLTALQEILNSSPQDR
jgi:polysaccharide biosynthesis protein PslH